MFELGAPHTTRQLIHSLAEQRREIAAFFASISKEEFFAAQGEHWSPAEHLCHVVKSVRPVAMALRVPKPALVLRLGFSTRGSRSFDAIVDAYRAELDGGGGAGRFAPSAAGSRAPGGHGSVRSSTGGTRRDSDLASVPRGGVRGRSTAAGCGIRCSVY